MTLLLIIRRKRLGENCNIIITAIIIITTKYKFDLIMQSKDIHSGLQITTELSFP